MLFTFFLTMFTIPTQQSSATPFCSSTCPPTLQEEYRTNYVPVFITAWHGPQIVAPDTPYVAATGKAGLYFLDTSLDPAAAQHIKDQIEWATTSRGADHAISIDEIAATAEVKDTVTGETLFVFDPVYARLLFAKGMNRHNPDLKLPEPEPAGDWLVTYDVPATLSKTD